MCVYSPPIYFHSPPRSELEESRALTDDGERSGGGTEGERDKLEREGKKLEGKGRRRELGCWGRTDEKEEEEEETVEEEEEEGGFVALGFFFRSSSSSSSSSIDCEAEILWSAFLRRSLLHCRTRLLPLAADGGAQKKWYLLRKKPHIILKEVYLPKERCKVCGNERTNRQQRFTCRPISGLP